MSGLEAGVLQASILPGFAWLWGSPCGRDRLRLLCATGQGSNPAAAEVLPVPAQHVVTVPLAWWGQKGCSNLGMALLPCCFLPAGSEGGYDPRADPLPCLGSGLLPGVHHEQLVRGAGCSFRRQDAGSEPGLCVGGDTTSCAPAHWGLAQGTGTAAMQAGTVRAPPRPLGTARHTWTAVADVRLDQSRDAPAARGYGCCDPVLAQEQLGAIGPFPARP